MTVEQARELVLATFGREDPGDDAWTFATAWIRQFSAPGGEPARRDEIACAFAAGRDYAAHYQAIEAASEPANEEAHDGYDR